MNSIDIIVCFSLFLRNSHVQGVGKVKKNVVHFVCIESALDTQVPLNSLAMWRRLRVQGTQNHTRTNMSWFGI